MTLQMNPGSVVEDLFYTFTVAVMKVRGLLVRISLTSFFEETTAQIGESKHPLDLSSCHREQCEPPFY